VVEAGPDDTDHLTQPLDAVTALVIDDELEATRYTSSRNAERDAKRRRRVIRALKPAV
jgi:hypothetical protein